MLTMQSGECVREVFLRSTNGPAWGTLPLGRARPIISVPPSKLGLTSPVGGALGRFPVDQANLVILKAPRFEPTVSNDQWWRLRCCNSESSAARGK